MGCLVSAIRTQTKSIKYVEEGAMLAPEHRNADFLVPELKFGPPQYVYYYT